MEVRSASCPKAWAIGEGNNQTYFSTPPKANFSGEIARELKSLVDRELVRVLHLVLLRKDVDESFEPIELDEVDERDVGELLALEPDLALLLAEEDVVDAIAEALERGSIAGVLVRENRWAGPFGSGPCAALEVSSSHTAGSQRRHCWPPSERARKPSSKEPDVPLARARVGRPGMIGAPVARTAVVVGTAAVVAHGVDRRQDRRELRRLR